MMRQTDVVAFEAYAPNEDVTGRKTIRGMKHIVPGHDKEVNLNDAWLHMRARCLFMVSSTSMSSSRRAAYLMPPLQSLLQANAAGLGWSHARTSARPGCLARCSVLGRDEVPIPIAAHGCRR